MDELEGQFSTVDAGHLRRDGRPHPSQIGAQKLEALKRTAFRLGEKAAELAPSQPWGDTRGLGNRLRHAYDRIDLDTGCPA
jgi:hypothetical protein